MPCSWLCSGCDVTNDDKDRRKAGQTCSRCAGSVVQGVPCNWLCSGCDVTNDDKDRRKGQTCSRCAGSVVQGVPCSWLCFGCDSTNDDKDRRKGTLVVLFMACPGTGSGCNVTNDGQRPEASCSHYHKSTAELPREGRPVPFSLACTTSPVSCRQRKWAGVGTPFLPPCGCSVQT